MYTMAYAYVFQQTKISAYMPVAIYSLFMTACELVVRLATASCNTAKCSLDIHILFLEYKGEESKHFSYTIWWKLPNWLKQSVRDKYIPISFSNQGEWYPLNKDEYFQYNYFSCYNPKGFQMIYCQGFI